MTLSEFIKRIQSAMNAKGSKLTVDGDFGPITSRESDKYDFELLATAKAGQPAPRPFIASNPAYAEAKKYVGSKETDSKFNAFLSGFWKLVGLPNYKTIIGASFAWCGLFIFAMNTQVGQKAISGAAGARNWAKYGVEVNWKRDGIPRGAVIHVNHAGNCSSGSSNHVTFADGDCTASDLLAPGASFPGFGGNQANAVKRSMYGVKEICEVRWPAEIALPGPIVKSDGCSGSGSSESTQ